MSGEAEKAECPDGDIDFKSENELEHSNTDQNRNRIDAGTVDEVIELHLDDDQLPQSPDNHSNEEMQQPPKRAKTKGGLINRPGCVCTCGGLHFGNYGHVNQQVVVVVVMSSLVVLVALVLVELAVLVMVVLVVIVVVALMMA